MIVKVQSVNGSLLVYDVDERHSDNADHVRRYGNLVASKLRGVWHVRTFGRFSPASDEIAKQLEAVSPMVEL